VSELQTFRSALQQGEEGGEILEGDLATCNVHISLERLGAAGMLTLPITPLAVNAAHHLLTAVWLWSLFPVCVSDAARTPFFPGSKEEGWWVFLADVSSNALLAAQKVRCSA
jgi:hypothetical protein